MTKTKTRTNSSAAHEIELLTSVSNDVASTFSGVRNEVAFAPGRALQLGYINLGDDHPRPKPNQDYTVVSASSDEIAHVSVPATPFRRLHLDLYEFFIDDMPDFLTPNNEGLLKVQVSTKNPQDLGGSMFDAAFVTEFRGKDNSYAPTFLYRGVFRNVIFQDWVTLKVELYELDTDASEYYDKIKKVIDGVPEVKTLDILNGIPYLNLATKLFEGIIKTFGKNPDDHLWGELPILEVDPTPGGAFLRSGIYILAEKRNSRDQELHLEELTYRNARLVHSNGVRMSSHLLFGVSVVEHTPAGQ